MNDMALPLRELHLFAGIGCGILGSILLGHRPVCAVELNPYARSVLLARQRDGYLPRFPVWDDVKTFDGRPWRGAVDVVCGGFPCQDISSAGTRIGIEGSRSGLWSEFARIIGEVQPRYALVENSAMLVNSGLGTVLGDLAEMGFDAQWGVFSACAVGAPHTRERLFLLAYSSGIHGNMGHVHRCGRQQTREPGNMAQMQKDWAQCVERNVGSGLGPPDRVERCRGIGNGQVPRVVRVAWQALSDRAWQSEQPDPAAGLTIEKP